MFSIQFEGMKFIMRYSAVFCFISILGIPSAEAVSDHNGKQSKHRTMPQRVHADGAMKAAVVETSHSDDLKHEELEVLGRINDIVLSKMNDSAFYVAGVDWSIVWPALAEIPVFSVDGFMEAAADYAEQGNFDSFVQLLNAAHAAPNRSQEEYSYTYALLFLALASQEAYYQSISRESLNKILFHKLNRELNSYIRGPSDYHGLMERLTPFSSRVETQIEKLDYFLHSKTIQLNQLKAKNQPVAFALAFEQSWGIEEEDSKLNELENVLDYKGVAVLGDVIELGASSWRKLVEYPRFKMVSLMLDVTKLQRNAPRCEMNRDEDCYIPKEYADSIILFKKETDLESLLAELVKESRYIDIAWYHWKLNPYEKKYKSEYCEFPEYGCHSEPRAEKRKLVRSIAKNDGRKRGHHIVSTIEDRNFLMGTDVLMSVSNWESLASWLNIGQGKIREIKENALKQVDISEHYRSGLVEIIKLKGISFEEIIEALRKMQINSIANKISKYLDGYR